METQREQSGAAYNGDLLDRAQAKWNFGDCKDLSNFINPQALQHHPYREKLALMVAAGKFQTGNLDEAKKYILLANSWGCEQTDIVKKLTAGVHNSIGRAALLFDDLLRAENHFHASIAVDSSAIEIRFNTRKSIAEQVEKIRNKFFHNIYKDERVVGKVKYPDDVSESYDKKFYDCQKKGSELSASVVLPLFFRYFKPNSIIDVGCGTGTWVKVAIENGVNECLGVDGKYAVPELVIPLGNFKSYDISTPMKEYGKFELAMSLEVAEHLDKSRAEEFVKDLCGLSDTILFSAAIPYQGGTDHRNENWPEYWAEKFTKCGYVVFDFIREKIWNDNRVEWWYRQNILVFSREPSVIGKFPKQKIANSNCLLRIHPELFLKRVQKR